MVEEEFDEDVYFEDKVASIFEDLCDMYADEIEERGMNSRQRASLMARARKIAQRQISKRSKNYDYDKR